MGSIYYEDVDNSYLTINQVIKDNYNKIWIVNPYSEHNNNPIAIKSSNQWYHIHDSSDDGYIPKEITFDTNNNFVALDGFMILIYSDDTNNYKSIIYEKPSINTLINKHKINNIKI